MREDDESETFWVSQRDADKNTCIDLCTLHGSIQANLS